MSALATLKSVAIGAFAVLVCGGMIAATVAQAELYRMTGEAFDPEQGDFRYREVHQFDTRSLQHRVDYHDHQHGLLASKTLDYSGDRFAPSFSMNFNDSPLVYGAHWHNGSLELFNNCGEEQREAIAPAANAPLVVDGGFIFFIEEHFDQLLNRQSVTFDFAWALRITTITLELTQVDIAQFPLNASDFELDSAGLVVFSARPTNWLLRPLAPEIYFAYHKADRSLQLFYGPSNLVDEDGDADQVVIRYHHPLGQKTPSVIARAVTADRADKSPERE